MLITDTRSSKNDQFSIADFTTRHYRELLQLAKRQYRFVSYEEMSSVSSFILWRHDCDYSLQRSLRLAQIEREEGVLSTFFLNPHSEFYNILEKGQTEIVKQMIAMGHKIGLHFDAAYYDVKSEDELDRLVRREADQLSVWFDVDIEVFSFHNPNEFLLSCQKSRYGGLINCYSSYFREEVGYCSDSNGYWRFRRLYDVLEEAEEEKLQVLTHPGWWQEEPMLPRERILRTATGRAEDLMAFYDRSLEEYGRTNVGAADTDGG